MTTRILVIGGRGFYGAKVVAELGAHEVRIGSRAAAPGDAEAVRVDLERPETFEAFADFDLIVNCSDSVNAPPDAAIDHVLREGGTWLEMGADAPTIERLLARPPADAKGTALLGVGVFPGLSTSLARAVAARGPTCATLELGIRISPLSGAGRGNCALMARSLFVPAYRYVDGARVQSRTALGPKQVLRFEDGPAAASNFALPDTALIQRATGVANVAAHMALIPGWLRLNFALLAWVAWLLRAIQRPVEWMLEWQMIVLRAWLLRGRESSVELVAIADRGTQAERAGWLRFEDGQRSTALGVAAAVGAWLALGSRPTGMHALAQVVSLEALLAALQRHGAATEPRWSGGSDLEAADLVG